MAFTVPTFTKLRIVERIYLEIFCTEFCPDRLGKLKYMYIFMYAPLVQNDCQLFDFHENITFSMIFKETTTRKFYDYRTDRLVVGSMSQIDIEGYDLYKSFFFTL